MAVKAFHKKFNYGAKNKNVKIYFFEEPEHFCILIVYIDRGDKIAVQNMFTKNIFKICNKSQNFAIYRVKGGKERTMHKKLTIHRIYGIL